MQNKRIERMMSRDRQIQNRCITTLKRTTNFSNHISSLEHPLAVTRIRRIAAALDIALVLPGVRIVLVISRILLLQPQRNSGVITIWCRRDLTVVEQDHALAVWLWRVWQSALFDLDDARVRWDARRGGSCICDSVAAGDS